MIFVHPWLLYLLPLAAIPIILHLLTLFRLRTVELSTFRFLFDSYLQQRRRMKFLEALLAMLRTLFLVLLILVIARPMVRHWNDLFPGGSGGREVILLVDCSASMNAQTAGEAAFKRATRAARAVVKRLGPEDRVTLVRVAGRPEEVFSSFSSDVEGIEKRIDGLVATPARANFYAAFMQVFGPEAPKRTNPVVYLFTDCQSTGWNEVRRQGLERVLPPKTPLVVVNVGSNEELPNLAVLGDPPPRQRAVVGLPLRLRARVANYAKEPAEVTLRAFVKEQEIYRKRLALRPGEVAVRKVPFTPTEAGTHHGRFEITGAAADRFPGDDSFLFTVTAVPRVKVLVVNGNPSADPEVDETVYLRALGAIFAGRPGEKAGKETAKVKALRELAQSLDLRETPEAGLTAEALKGAGVVALANCGGLSDVHFSLLRQYVAAGGGLLVFPGEKVNPVLYNTRFFTNPDVPKDRLTPAQLGQPQGDPEDLRTYEQLAAVDFSHPVLAVFDEPRRRVPYFKNVYFYRRFPLTVPDARKNPGSERAGFWPLAEFASGALALVENQYGDGLVVVAAFPLSRKGSNLPVENGTEFVPLMLRLLSHVQRRADLEARPVVVPGDIVEISAAGAWNPAVCKVTNPGGRTSPVSLERSGSRLLGAFEETGERGYYTIDARPEGGESAKGASRDFAVNIAPEESDFRTLDRKDFEELFPDARLTYVDASAEAQQLRSLSDDLEEPVWRPLIYLMFVIIGVEFLLATLSGKRRDVDEGADGGERVRQVKAGAWMGRLAAAPGERAQ
jgi:hypothetical protein